jgi:hypothetical protein
VGLGDGLYCGGVWNWSDCRLAITSACPVMRTLHVTLPHQIIDCDVGF